MRFRCFFGYLYGLKVVTLVYEQLRILYLLVLLEVMSPYFITSDPQKTHSKKCLRQKFTKFYEWFKKHQHTIVLTSALKASLNSLSNAKDASKVA